MKAVLLLVAFVAFAAAQPIRPVISETFEGEGYSHIITVNESIWGLGRWVIDEPAGHALENWEFTAEHRHHTVHLLKRYDLGFEYAVTHHHHPTPHRVCRKIAVKPPMPPAWHWLREARYHGKHVIDEVTFDLWAHHAAGIELSVAVGERDASRPHYFARRTPSEHRTYHMISWATFKPNATWFNVPDICKNVTEETPAIEWLRPGQDMSHAPICGVAASSARRIVETSNGFDAASFLEQVFANADIKIDSNLWSQQQAGEKCEGGARVGDVFFDGVPATSVAVYLGDNEFAECPAYMGGRCNIVGFRDFTGGCRRFC